MGTPLGLAVLLTSLTVLFVRFRRNYHHGLVTSVFLLVFMPDSVAIYPPSPIPALTIHRLTLLMLLLFWCKNRNARTPSGPIPFMRFQVALLVGFGASTLMPIVTPNTYLVVTLKQYLDYVTGVFLLFKIFQTSLHDRATIQSVIRMLAVALIVVAFFGYTERYLHFAVTDMLPRTQGRYEFEALFSSAGRQSGDIISTYRHRILFGIACAIGLATLLSRCNSRKSALDLGKWLWICFLAGGVYFSASRTPWVGFVIATIYMSLLVFRKLMKRSVALVLLGGLAFLARPGAWTSLEALFLATANEDSIKGSSANWRAQLFQHALHIVTTSGPHHFVFGYGGGSRSSLAATLPMIQLSTGRWVAAESWDNDYAIALLEQGVWGFIVKCSFYLYALALMSRYVLRTTGRDDAMLFALYVLCVTVACRALVSFFAPQLEYIEAIVLAIASRLIQTKGALPAKQDVVRPTSPELSLVGQTS